MAILWVLTLILGAMAGPWPAIGILGAWLTFGAGVAFVLGLVSPQTPWIGKAGEKPMCMPTHDDETLASHAHWDKHAGCRMNSLLQLLARAPLAEVTRRALLGALHDPSPMIRLVAVRHCERSPCRRDTLIRLLHGDDVLIACEAIQLFATSERPEAAEAQLIDIAARYRGARQEEAIRALAEVGTLAALWPLRWIGSTEALRAIRCIQDRVPGGGRGQLSLSAPGEAGALSEVHQTGALTLVEGL